MSLKSLSLTIGFLGIFLLPLTSFAAPTFLYFEDLPAGARVDDEYAAQGVHFYNDYVPGQIYRSSPIVADSPIAHSDQVLQNNAYDDEINSSSGIPLAAWFDQPVTGVGMWLAKQPGCFGFDVTATVTLFDCEGDQVAQDSTLVSNSGTPFQVLDPTGQATCVFVDYTGSCEEIVDDFAFDFSGNTCSDNSKPIVFITNPGYVYSTNSASTYITGRVYETSMRLASMQINGQDIPFRPRTSDPKLFDFNVSVSLVEGKNSFTILAVDGAGNKGSAQVFVNRGTPSTAMVKGLHITQRGLMENTACDIDTPFVAGKSTVIRLDLEVKTASGYNTYFNTVDLNVYRKVGASDVLQGTYTGSGHSPYQTNFTNVYGMSGIHYYLDGSIFSEPGEYSFTVKPYFGITAWASEIPLSCGGQYLTFTGTKPVKVGILPVAASLYDTQQTAGHVANYFIQLETLARTFPVADGISTLYTGYDTGVKWYEFAPFNFCDGSTTMENNSKWCSGTGYEWTFMDTHTDGVLNYVTTIPVAATTETVCDPNRSFLGGEEPQTGRVLKSINYNGNFGLFRGGAHPFSDHRYYPICDDDHDGSINQTEINNYVAQIRDDDAVTPGWTTDLTNYSVGDVYRNFADTNNDNCKTKGETEAPVTGGLWRNAKDIVFKSEMDAVAQHNSYWAGDDNDLDIGALFFPVLVHPNNVDGLFYGPGSSIPSWKATWIRVVHDQTMAHESGHIVGGLPDDYGSPDPPRSHLHPWQAYSGFEQLTGDMLNNIRSVMWRSSSPAKRYFFPDGYYQTLFDALKVTGSRTDKAPAARPFFIQGVLNEYGEPMGIEGALVEGLEATDPVPGERILITAGTGTVTLLSHSVAVDTPTNDQESPDTGLLMFTAVLDLPLTATWVKIYFEEELLAEFYQSDSSPEVAFTRPAEGSAYGATDTVSVTWEMDDQDSAVLTSTLLYSPDGDTDWVVVASGLTGSEYEWDTSAAPGAPYGGRLKIRTSDGFNTTEALSASFTLEGKPPVAQILFPSDGRTFVQCTALPPEGQSGTRFSNRKAQFKALAFDPENDLASTMWFVDGAGPVSVSERLEMDLTTFSAGTHTMRFAARDGDDNVDYDEITFHVLPDSDCDGMSDKFEEDYGLDPGDANDAAENGDSDGLTNAEEAWYGTRPDMADSDSDGMDDDYEVANNLNPLVDESSEGQDYSGWWWDSEHPGTGYSLEVQNVPDKYYDLAYMVWYLYTEEGVNTWYSSIMKVTGDTMTGELVEYDGWPLEPGTVSDTTVARTIGQVTMSFSDINTGVITYTVDSQEYQRPIERWEPDGEQDPRSLLGWWWDTDKQGVGWFIESRNNRFFLGWYNYRQPPERTGGMPRWHITVDFDFAANETTFSQPLLDYSDGQTLTGEWQDPTPTIENSEENFEFSIPAGSPPESIDIIYEGNAFHLTRFQIPDIFNNRQSRNLHSASSYPVSRQQENHGICNRCGKVVR